LALTDSCVFGRGQAEFGGTLLSGARALAFNREMGMSKIEYASPAGEEPAPHVPFVPDDADIPEFTWTAGCDGRGAGDCLWRIVALPGA